MKDDEGEEIKIIGIAKQIISHGSSHTVDFQFQAEKHLKDETMKLVLAIL